MGLEPTRDAEQRLSDGFEDRGFDVRVCPLMFTQDGNL